MRPIPMPEVDALESDIASLQTRLRRAWVRRLTTQVRMMNAMIGAQARKQDQWRRLVPYVKAMHAMLRLRGSVPSVEGSPDR